MYIPEPASLLGLRAQSKTAWHSPPRGPTATSPLPSQQHTTTRTHAPRLLHTLLQDRRLVSCSSSGQFTNGRTSASAVAMPDASQWRAQTSRPPPIGGHPTCLALPSPCSKPTRASHVRVLRGTRERQHSPTQSPSPHNPRLAVMAKRVLFRHLNNPEKLWSQFMGFFHIIGIGIVQRDRSSKAAAFLSPLVGCRRFFFRNNVLLISLARMGLAPPLRQFIESDSCELPGPQQGRRPHDVVLVCSRGGVVDGPSKCPARFAPTTLRVPASHLPPFASVPTPTS